MSVDIERSGVLFNNDTIGIGVAVVNEDGTLVESKLWKNYHGKAHTNFEQRSWNEFWINKQDILEKLRYDGPLNKEDNQKRIIEEFHQFRNKYEKLAKDNNAKFVFCSDNPSFDIAFINKLYFDHSNYLPLPYRASDKEYSMVYDTSSMQIQYLKAHDPTYNSIFGMSQRILKLTGRKYSDISYDHLPHNDAYTIAFDYVIINNL